MSNVMNGGSLLDLAGMGPDGVVNGVAVWRPLLRHDKGSIFAFAHRHGVPYFKDTTPRWSTRGKLRGRLLPLLAEVYGDGYARALSRLAAESSQLRALTERRSLGPFRTAVVRAPLGDIVDTAPFRTEGRFFWREVMRELLHARGMAMVSEKAISSLVALLGGDNGEGEEYSISAVVSAADPPPNNSAARRGGAGGRGGGHGKRGGRPAALPLRPRPPPPRNGWIELRRGYGTYLDGTKLYIFDSKALPVDGAPHSAAGTAIPLGGTSSRLGPWRVTATVVAGGEESRDEDLEMNAPIVSSMQHLFR